MFKKIKKHQDLLFQLFKVVLITSIVSFAVSPFSCRATEEGIILIDENYSCPKIENFYVTGENTARIVFDQKIRLKEFSMNPEISVEKTEISCSEIENSLCLVDVVFSENLAIGKTYNFYGEVCDNLGNSLTFSLPLLGFNAKIPDLLITEVHPKYSSGTNSSGKYFKCEYVELLALSDGNLSGLELLSANDGAEKSFVFPAVEVSKGEIIIAHFRKKEENALSELDSDLSLSKAKYSSDLARDLWAENESARLGDTSDVIVLRNSKDESIIDCVCYADVSVADWKSEEMKRTAELAVAAGKWTDTSIDGAVRMEKMTATKSLERISAGNAADCWRLSSTSGETPGILQFAPQ